METIIPKEKKENNLCKLLLEMGTLLMSSGANTSRIRTTISRIASAYNYHAELLVTHRALMLTLYGKDKDLFYSRLKRTLPHGSNFKMVSGISRMSWKIVEEKWSLEKVEKELEILKNIPRYPRWIVLLVVSLAGTSFCGLAGGKMTECIVAFIATFCGLFIRQETAKKGYNGYLCVFAGAFISSMLAGLTVKYNIGNFPQRALASSVLYLIPGIPLINTFSDLVEGNIMNGIVRGVNGLIISFAIALGMMSAILIYHI